MRMGFHVEMEPSRLCVGSYDRTMCVCVCTNNMRNIPVLQLGMGKLQRSHLIV